MKSFSAPESMGPAELQSFTHRGDTRGFTKLPLQAYLPRSDFTIHPFYTLRRYYHTQSIHKGEKCIFIALEQSSNIKMITWMLCLSVIN